MVQHHYLYHRSNHRLYHEITDEAHRLLYILSLLHSWYFTSYGGVVFS